jgi:hypothetical protein
LFPEKAVAIKFAKEQLSGCRTIWVHNDDATIEEKIIIPWFVVYINDAQYNYQIFTFKWEMQDHTFCGADFIGMNRETELVDLSALDRIKAAGMHGFMPELVKTIGELIGDGNYIYAGYAFSIKIFNLCFLIKENIYKDKLDLIEKWKKYNSFDQLMSWDVQSLNECQCQ